MNTLAELRNLGMEELKKELTKAKQEIYRLSLLVRTGTEKNTSLISKAKRYAAQVATVINELSKVKV